MSARPSVRVHPWRGEAAVTLAAGNLSATFLPEIGMLGVSLRHQGEEILALPHSLAEYRQGLTTGFGLLHPWANRLGSRHFRTAGRRVDLTGIDLPTDPNGLPIHGTCHAQPFEVVTAHAGPKAARLTARLDFGARTDLLASFPYPHDLRVEARLGPTGLRITTAVLPSAGRPVPVSFGWHPYLRLPGVPRRDWLLRLPGRRELHLDSRGLPSGDETARPAGLSPVGTRTYDHHFRLGRDRVFSVEGGGRRLEVRLGAGYPYAQVYPAATGGFRLFRADDRPGRRPRTWRLPPRPPGTPLSRHI